MRTTRNDRLIVERTPNGGWRRVRSGARFLGYFLALSAFVSAAAYIAARLTGAQ